MNRALVSMFALACAAFVCPAQLPAQATGTTTVLPTIGNAVLPAQAEGKQMDHMRSMLADWPNLARYRAEDAALPPAAPGVQRVVFFGASVIDRWGRRVGVFFPGEPYINRGISGQTMPQMLIRFQQDVVHLHPAAVIVLAGANDIAGNTGPSTPQMIEDNFVSMAAIAKQSGIKMVIASILPAAAFPWRPGIKPAEQIRQLNQWLKDFCAREGLVYLDYYSSMVDGQGGMRPGLSSDGVHPTVEGYAIMAPLAEAAIKQALKP